MAQVDNGALKTFAGGNWIFHAVDELSPIWIWSLKCNHFKKGACR